MPYRGGQGKGKSRGCRCWLTACGGTKFAHLTKFICFHHGDPSIIYGAKFWPSLNYFQPSLCTFRTKTQPSFQFRTFSEPPYEHSSYLGMPLLQSCLPQNPILSFFLGQFLSDLGICAKTCGRFVKLIIHRTFFHRTALLKNDKATNVKSMLRTKRTSTVVTTHLK